MQSLELRSTTHFCKPGIKIPKGSKKRAGKRASILMAPQLFAADTHPTSQEAATVSCTPASGKAPRGVQGRPLKQGPRFLLVGGARI